MLAVGQIPFNKYPFAERLAAAKKRLSTPPASLPTPSASPLDQAKVESPTNPENKAKEAVAQEQVKTQLQSQQKIDKLLKTGGRNLMKVSSVFPFTLFIDDLVVDENKISFVFRTFFLSDHVHSVLIDDISDVIVQTSIFFATLKVVDRNFSEGMIEIRYLPRDQAVKARQVIQGLVIAKKEKIDLSELGDDELIAKAQELGKALHD